MEPTQSYSSAQLVRNGLMLLASRHPAIPPDKVAYLADELLDWDQLVKNDFAEQWRELAEEMCNDELELVRESGRERREFLRGPATLERLLDAAKRDDQAFGQLQCAFIIIGNLIESAIYRTHPKLAQAIQLQINSFWNASANQALADSEFGNGRVVTILPEHDPMPPELEEE